MFKDINNILVGNPYKGNLHSHTVNSDGHLTPKESAEAYYNHGYSFLCLSEHNIYTDYRNELNKDDFIILPGLEAAAVLFKKDSKSFRPLKVHHIHGILGPSSMVSKAKSPFKNFEEFPPPVFYDNWDGLQVAKDLCKALEDKGCFTTYNHPIWSRVDIDEVCDLTSPFAIEIYNYDTELESFTGYDINFWDTMLRRGNKINAFASDDNHNQSNLPDSFGGWVVVYAKELTHDNITTALINGNYYSSSGPSIYGYGVKDNKVWIECSHCSHVNFIIGNLVGHGLTVWSKNIDGITSASYDLQGDETYVRIECVDFNGKKAWTNPMFLEEV